MPHPPLAPQLIALACSVVLLSLYIAAQAGLSVQERGLPWAAGPRDEAIPLRSPAAARAQRALENFKETYPVFLALAVALVAAGRAEGLGAIGAWVWLGARIVYLPVYLMGMAIRPLVYVVSLAGIGMMVGALLAG